MARLVRAATDRNPPTLGGGGCQLSRVSQGLPAFYSPVYDGPPGGYVDRGPVSR